MNCRGCQGDVLEAVYEMAPMPVAGDFKPSRIAALAAPRYPLTWLRCNGCGLVNVDPSMEPDWGDYSYHASEVPALRRHHELFAQWLADRFRPALHIEIGGNDGVLARHVPWASLNIDPSDAWQGPGVNAPFTLELAKTLPKADLVTASNSLAHFEGLSDAFHGIRYVLRSSGAFVMEVHDLDATLRDGQWDTIYHEHAAEWDADSLYAVGKAHGLDLVHVERLPLHGGLLRAVFRPGMPHRVAPELSRDFGDLQRAYDEAEAPELPDGSVAYGAAARATVYLTHTRPNVVAVIDGSLRRQGRFVPVLGLPILPPQDFGDPPAALITAIGHEADIMAAHPGYDGWVRWLA